VTATPNLPANVDFALCEWGQWVFDRAVEEGDKLLYSDEELKRHIQDKGYSILRWELR
jgi:hypothetical protein